MNTNSQTEQQAHIYSMSKINQQQKNNSTEHESTEEKDVAEESVHIMHIALPIAGAILMFLLAFIAVTMA